MTSAATLEYAGHQPPNRYEWEMESERARWLRRRFLWFTGTLVVLGLVMLPLSLTNLLDNSGYGVAAGFMQVFAALVQLGAAGWAWWYARQKVRNERRLFAIAFWLVVGLGVFGIFAARISGELSLQAEIQRMERRAAGEAEDFTVRRPITIEMEDGAVSAVPTRGPRGAPNPSMIRAIQQSMSLGIVTWSVLTSHLFACLFLPWTVREATRPALLLLGGAGVMIAADLLLGRASLWYLAGALVFLPLTVLPGIGWSWWRYSRFRRRFRSVFESQQLRQLTYELSGARRIHETSLPPVFPTGPLRLSYIYEPMSQIGGDLLFVHPRPPETPPSFENAHDLPPPPRQTLVLLDVTGHGIAAALTVNRLVGELERVFAERPDISPGDLIASLNRYVFLTLATHGVFVTGVAIGVDASECRDCAAAFRDPHLVSFASAGHPTTFLRRADGRIESLESNATMLGVLPPDQYHPQEHVFRLRPGEAIIAYTDGALEARNLDDEMIGMDGVRDLIGEISRDWEDPFRWPEQLIRRVAAWRASPPADDTLIACVYRPPKPAEAESEVQEQRLEEPELAALAG